MGSTISLLYSTTTLAKNWVSRTIFTIVSKTVEDSCKTLPLLNPNQISTVTGTLAPQIKHATSETFIFFPLLPKELRLEIWKIAAQQDSRNVHIRVFYKDKLHPDLKAIPPYDTRTYVALVGTEAEACTRYSHLLDYKVIQTVPVVLHVCTEARTEGLKKYHPLFKEDGNLPISYVNKHIDTVYISLYCARYAHIQFVLRDTLPGVFGKGAIGKEARISRPYGKIATLGYNTLDRHNLHRKTIRILDASGNFENIEDWGGWLAELRRVGEIGVMERFSLYVFSRSWYNKVLDMSNL